MFCAPLPSLLQPRATHQLESNQDQTLPNTAQEWLCMLMMEVKSLKSVSLSLHIFLSFRPISFRWHLTPFINLRYRLTPIRSVATKKNPSASHRTRCSVRYRVITKFTLNFNTFLFHLHKRTYAPNGVPSLVQVCPPTVEFKSTSQMWRVRSVGRIHTFPFCRVPINGGHLIRFHQFTYAIAIE